MPATLSLIEPSTIDGIIRFVWKSPHVSSIVGGIGLGNLAAHLPHFRQEKAQTLGIGALTLGYFLDSASHIYLAGASIGALGIVGVGLLAGGTAVLTYTGIAWAGKQKGDSNSRYATAAVAVIGGLHFGSHGYIAARGLLGTVYSSASLFGAGVLGLVGNLGLVAIASYTLYAELKTHGSDPKTQASPVPTSGRTKTLRYRRSLSRQIATLFRSNRVKGTLRAKPKAA